MSDRLKPGRWTPTGNDYVTDGLWGRLGAQEKFGDTRISGSANGVAAVEDPKAPNTFLYVGASNGGVYLRVYDRKNDQWSSQWRWQSAPGSGYTGSQAIALLVPSPDGRYLAAAQGNPSSFRAFAPPSRGLQIARIRRDGALSWLQLSSKAQSLLNGLNVRSLVWQGGEIRGTTWDRFDKKGVSFSARVDNGIVDDVVLRDQLHLNLVSDSVGDHYLEAGYDAETGENQISLDGRLLQNKEDAISFAPNERIARVSIFPDLIDSRLIAFVGTFYLSEKTRNGPIFRVLRLEIDPLSGEIVDSKVTRPVAASGGALNPDPATEFGSNQAANLDFYGNFSFVADPYDPLARSVFVGGNVYAQSPLANSPLYTGGLVRVDFRGVEPVRTPLYGPRILRNRSDVESDFDYGGGVVGKLVELDSTYTGKLVVPFNPGAPHADSRSIAFYRSAQGPALLQTDDGGIWTLPQERTENGLMSPPDAWWSSLSAPGMATLETNMVDWNSTHNAIVSSYQDNASSIGFYGDSSATNFDSGDGQIALFDDASRKRVTAYKGVQRYFQRGGISATSFDRSGFPKSTSDKLFYLLSSKGLLPWPQTPEFNQQSAPFLLPVEQNAYRSGSLVQTGSTNIYEQVEAGSYGDVAIFFRPLLPESDEQRLFPSALDVQSNAPGYEFSSIYVGAVIPRGDGSRHVSLLGREANNSPEGYRLGFIKFLNLDQNALYVAGSILDVSQAQLASEQNIIYWLQGGRGLQFNTLSTPAEDQILRFGRPGGFVQSLRLAELGLPFTPGDSYGYQALQYIPASDHHPELLLIAGLNGVWSSEIDAEGFPAGFSPMAWQGLPQTGPGAYIKTLVYDPIDDIVIAGSQGKGSYLYSFGGDLGERVQTNRILHASNLTVPLAFETPVDKRGNEQNVFVAVALDGRLVDPDENQVLEFKLHNTSAWRKAMEFVSPYNTNISPSFKTSGAKGAVKAFRYNNILDPLGLEYRGGEQRGGNLYFPLEMAAGSTLFNLQLNTKDGGALKGLAPLKYTVRLKGTNEKVTRTVSFKELPPFSEFAGLEGNALVAADPVTGLDASGRPAGAATRQRRHARAGAAEPRDNHGDLLSNSIDHADAWLSGSMDLFSSNRSSDIQSFNVAQTVDLFG